MALMKIDKLFVNEISTVWLVMNYDSKLQTRPGAIMPIVKCLTERVLT